MLVTPTSLQQTKQAGYFLSGTVTLLIAALSFIQPWCLLALPLAYGAYWWVVRKPQRRLRALSNPFPKAWEQTLQSHVEFFRALDGDRKNRFRDLVKVFLNETPITGVRTDVDDLTRVLVAASAVIPIFGFDDWEYARLGEVLIYPGRFDENYETSNDGDARTLGMIGVNHLSGVMILSKPDLINGFSNSTDKRNVGIHEFAHLVDQADGSVDGIPAGIPSDVVQPWIAWVGDELKSSRAGHHHIDDYAYTNNAEYLAVLTEYFFESPELLEQKNPRMYQMLQKMYRQNTKGLLGQVMSKRRKRVGRNAPCPCGSGQKYKRCCRAA